MPSNVQYVVVENAGYEGECDVAKFGTRWAAERWMERTYSAREIDALHMDICIEEDGQRTYDPCGFGPQ
ncbi:MAG TPA: hypothetical protein VNS79_03755 [Sphingobium sp.]|nr:hypothetical protein [Sphingobium sp.]